MTPFADDYKVEEELQLIKEAQDGSKQALEKLVKLHQRFIYNLALAFIKNPDDAADLTQEVLIKMITKLSSFNCRSSFRTWLYRIVFNHFMNAKNKKKLLLTTFEDLGVFLDTVHANEFMNLEEQETYSKLIDDTRNQCISGMLLCLESQQRMVFILGAIFHLKSTVAAPILGITAANFRQLLARAKRDLFNFMENKCGLINPVNPCRCHKKTMGFITEGKVTPSKMVFKLDVINTIQSISPAINYELDELLEGKYMSLFSQQTYQKYDKAGKLVSSLIFDEKIKRMFHLN